MDFSKIFDYVPHNGLHYKLENYDQSIRGDTLKWIKAFLENRQQSVVVDGERCDFVAVLSCVPRGSVIGPVLFLAYISNLSQNIHVRSRVHLFADYTIFCERFEPRSHFKSRLSLIARVNILLNRTVVVDSD